MVDTLATGPTLKFTDALSHLKFVASMFQKLRYDQKIASGFEVQVIGFSTKGRCPIPSLIHGPKATQVTFIIRLCYQLVLQFDLSCVLMPFHWCYLLEDLLSYKTGHNLVILLILLQHSSFPFKWQPPLSHNYANF
jgi:hypothetical protein